MKPLRISATALFGAAILLLAGTPGPARAALGETSASVARDAARMKAAVVQAPEVQTPQAAPSQTANFTVMSMKTATGVTVREYLTPGGTVFAVSWRGSVPPNVAVLLGAYFIQYRDAAAAGSPTTFGIHNAAVSGPDVTVETGGHMGDLRGRAYLPAMLPPGVELSEIE